MLQNNLIKFLSSVFLLTFAVSVYSQKITPEEIVSKHLESIGSKEKRVAIKNQTVLGSVALKIRSAAAPVNGKVVIFSAGAKNIWGMNLSSNDYPMDRFGYNGKETQAGYSRPGARSILSEFILSYPELLKEGLLGGTLTSSWALLNIDAKKPNLSFEGEKKIDGKQTYSLSFSPKNGSDLIIKMYFDAKTYQHVRTQYDRVISARQGATIDFSSGQGEDRYQMIEYFSDFKKAGGLTLPTSYTLTYEYSSSAAVRTSNNAPRYFEWRFNITDFSYNQQIEDAAFDINAK